ncbi:glycoside hydrolase 5 family protein [Amphibacillus sp. Q70]|uniref:glycoside hydrolase 5 family protein n=1 Tax=Amphibacillus sp. Q70 TaxID=3453416 RepID=UPI003F8489E3
MTFTGDQLDFQKNKNFIKRNGNRFELNGKKYRFSGPNIYWLGLDENVNGVDYPTNFRISNVLDTALEMGATVIRSHTLAASVGSAKSLQPNLGCFNEEAFKHVDFVLNELGKRGLRVVIPLVDNWNYYHGGRGTFTNWRGFADEDQFYCNEEIKNDFKHHISTVLNRVNHITGITYKDDPTIAAWELGNELEGTSIEWVREMIQYVKLIDTNHLVGFGNRFNLDQDKLSIIELDYIDAHYYPADPDQLTEDIELAEKASKPLLIGEFGWVDGDLDTFLRIAENNEGVIGTHFWSLFGHHDAFSYVDHFDSFTLHYPGSQTNADRLSRIQALRKHAFVMSEQSERTHNTPNSPIITNVNDKIYWRGVVGAASYTIERSTINETGPWNVVCEKGTSDQYGYWRDTTRDSMKDAWYRIKAHNLSGVAGPYSEVFYSKPINTHASEPKEVIISTKAPQY